MSMHDIRTNIVYGSSFAVTLYDVERTNHEIVEWQKDRSACDLGVKIASEKGWNSREVDDMLLFEMNLYVFTRNELQDYLDARFKSRLREMSEDKNYSDDQRSTLRIVSERF